MSVDRQAFEKTIQVATEKLLSERTTAGHWEGKLSSSALSTATSVCALTLSLRNKRGAANETSSDHRDANDLYKTLAKGGIDWLLQHQNEDGGWGDTIKSYSNVSTTVVCWSALGLPEWQDERVPETVKRAEQWLSVRAGDLAPDKIAAAVASRYGKDRTFSIPILTLCALCGRLGEGRDAWRYVLPLPFELAALPHQLFKWLRLPVVSYALPALIAIGQTRHHHRPTLNPFARLIRWLTRERTLSVLDSIQPTSGGFLEAAPLTGFVVMSLASMNLSDHPVTKRGLAFLADGVRDDGSWPIDTNLSIWTTTLAVNALTSARSTEPVMCDKEAKPIVDWLMAQQYRVEHPYTHAAPGGWAWTDLTGGIPDADDTPGALLALHNLIAVQNLYDKDKISIQQAAAAGCQWLLELQNRDGGMPTFCRGWGKLPFDRSSQDLAAHALRAWLVWHEQLPADMQLRIDLAIKKTLVYLLRVQRSDGAWTPLWFGNQNSSVEENLTYGTSRVLVGLAAFLLQQNNANVAYSSSYVRGVAWMCITQNEDGGWGADCEPSSIEETALAIDALCGSIQVFATMPTQAPQVEAVLTAINHGANWLIEHTNNGTRFNPSPIGFYFAKLWYFEELYPLAFTVGALNRARSVLWQ